MKKGRKPSKKSKKASEPKKRTIRSRTKYPALSTKVNLKSRVDDILDVVSYASQLSPDELEWMNKFMEEYNNASFSKSNKKNLMKSKQEKRDSYNRNNARNRDVYNRLKMNNDLVFIEDNDTYGEVDAIREESDEELE